MIQHPEIHLKVMRLILKQPKISQRELAKRTGVSLGSMHYCLKAMIAKGFVKIVNFHDNKNKLQYTYLLTSKGIAEKVKLTSRFLTSKIEEYNSLKFEIESLKTELDEESESRKNP